MKFDLFTVLNALPAIGPIAAQAPAFRALFDQIVATFDDEADQGLLKDALEDIRADNDAGFARLDAKLAAAAAR